MKEIVLAYIMYLNSFKGKTKPKMPNLNASAYTDSEYVAVIDSLNADFDDLDSVALTERFLKG